jgi:hypothetical protein
MTSAYKRRPQDFKRKVISKVYTNKKDLLEEEYRWLSMIKKEELGKRYYNIHNHHFSHWTNDEEKTKILSEIISQKTKEAMCRPEIREKYLAGLATRDTRSSDPTVREKRRVSMMGKNTGKDNSKAICMSAEMRRGKSLSQEHRDKIKCTTVFKDLNNKKIKCEYCNFEGNAGNIGRWHNDKCKQKYVCQ